jgi:hypothetical protein
MKHSEIVYNSRYNNSQVSLPINFRDWVREDGCKDIILSRVLALDCPLKIYIQITSAGKIKLCLTEWCNENNTYWHIYSAPSEYKGGKEHYLPITDEQARIITLVFAHRVSQEDVISPELPLSILHGLGGTPQELVADRGGVVGILERLGIPVPALTRPTWQDNDEVDTTAAQEASLELACENGMFPGAMPADL